MTNDESKNGGDSFERSHEESCPGTSSDHSSTESALEIRTCFDRTLIWDRGRSVRYLEIDVLAPPLAVATNSTEKRPLNLALVIDASNSMSGKPLECAKAAAIGVVNALSTNSKLSIISFANDVITHADCAPVDPRKQGTVLAAIEKLHPRGNTNLSTGWLKGTECLARLMEQTGRNMHNHVVLLSDGYANEGITDPQLLGHHAEQLRCRGIVTSTVGIGDEYSSHQLQALADHGGGRLHDAQFPQEIIEVVMGELQEVQEALIEDIGVTLSYPAGVHVENLSGFPTVVGSSSALTQIGMLSPGRRRSVIFRITAPDGHRGDKLAFEVSSSWVKTGTTERVQGARLTANLIFAPEQQNSSQTRDDKLSVRVARMWQSAIVRKCVALNREGDLKELARYLDDEIKYFSRYCAGLNDTAKLISELKTLREQANHRWDERSNKTMDYSNYMSQQSHRDYRSQQRGNWLDSLKKFTNHE